MRRICLSMAAMVVGSFFVAAPPEESPGAHFFEVKISSELENRIGPNEQNIKKQNIGTTAEIHYSWQSDGERVLTIQSVSTKTHRDGKTATEMTISREKIIKTSGEEATEVHATDAPEALRKLLQASYGAPLCKLQRDSNGKEIKRTIVAHAEAKNMIDSGIIENALLFHPPYYSREIEWDSDTAVSMGNGGLAKGKLHYKKSKGNNCEVTGSLGNEEFKSPNGLTLKKAQYVVDGSQVYDSALREWVSGKMKIGVGYDLYDGEVKLGTAKGTMHLVFQRVKPE